MVAFPNSVLIRASEDYLVDPGLIMQGAPLFGALASLGVEASEVGRVIMTHLHFDHAEALATWPQRTVYVHRLDTEAPYAQLVAGQKGLLSFGLRACGSCPAKNNKRD